MDPDIQARDIERGDAININDRSTIHAMSGSAERVVSDNSKTTFINPCMMYDEDGYTSEIFNQKIDWLESEIKKETAEAKETVTVYNLKKRLNSLKGNMVEVYVGGVTIADRDQARDLMEDAALNCRSAAKSGVGYGANYEGLRACEELASAEWDDESTSIINMIRLAYEEITKILYMTITNNEEMSEKYMLESLADYNKTPFNIRTKSFDGKVLSSIDTDICALDTISKIVTIMATSNQFILPTVNLNVY